MKINKQVLFGFFLLSISIVLTSCLSDYQAGQTVFPPAEPLEGIPDGTGTGVADGFASADSNFLDYNPEFGAPITVTVTVTAGFITAVTVDGPDESFGWGSVIIAQAPDLIRRMNRFELAERYFVNAVTGSTRTIDGVNNAGNMALEDIAARYRE